MLFVTGCKLATPPPDYRHCTSAERTSAFAITSECTTPSPCCALGEPDCGCVPYTTTSTGACLSICDAAPVGWKKALDERGCPVWLVPFGSCLPVDSGAPPG